MISGRGRSIARMHVLGAIVAALSPGLAAGQFIQQAPKLVPERPNDGSFVVNFGQAISLSADGRTAIIGAPDQDGSGDVLIWSSSGGLWRQAARLHTYPCGSANFGSPVGMSGDGTTAIIGCPPGNAVRIFTRNGEDWTPQGPELVGTGAAGFNVQGQAVALSFDGNTAIVGGPNANGKAGAVWIWTRTAGVWTQGAMLTGSGAAGPAEQGGSVALSADGSTALVGGRADNGGAGASWVWVRTAGGWAQQGAKLVGSGAIGPAGQGWSVAVSGDGRTALASGASDAGGAGALWVWTRNAGVWTQQGPKLVGVGAIGKAMLGGGPAGSRGEGNAAVALSFDGSFALAGGPEDNNRIGAAWVWRRTGEVWTQAGAKLTDVRAPLDAQHGFSVALSGDGTLALVGSFGNSVSVYAAPVTPLAPPRMDADDLADLARWQPLTGQWSWVTAATQFDAARAGSRSWGRGDHGDVPLMGDIDGDRIDDLIVWRAPTGTWYWLTSRSHFTAGDSRQWGNQALGDVPLLADIDGDGRAELVVWRASTGTWYWLTSSSGYAYAASNGKQWGNQALGDRPMLGDMDGDREADLVVWRASSGTWYWLTSSSGYGVAAARSVQWGNQALGDIPLLGDLDGDHHGDLVAWRADTGTWYWLTSSSGYSYAAAGGGVQWGDAHRGDIPMVGDIDGDGRTDLTIWRGIAGLWFCLTSASGYNYSAARIVGWTL